MPSGESLCARRLQRLDHGPAQLRILLDLKADHVARSVDLHPHPLIPVNAHTAHIGQRVQETPRPRGQLLRTSDLALHTGDRLIKTIHTVKIPPLIKHPKQNALHIINVIACEDSSTVRCSWLEDEENGILFDYDF